MEIEDLVGVKFDKVAVVAVVTTMLMNCMEVASYMFTDLPEGRMKGFDGLKLFTDSESCELIFTMDAPPELRDYETMRITNRNAKSIPDNVVKRVHSWAHRNNFLHSFFKPLYR